MTGEAQDANTASLLLADKLLKLCTEEAKTPVIPFIISIFKLRSKTRPIKSLRKLSSFKSASRRKRALAS